MRSRNILLVAVALLCIGVVRPAHALSVVTIDFEALPEGELVTNQFADDLILFSNLQVREAFSSLNEIDFPPTSGVHAVSGIGLGPAVIEFLQPARMFNVQLTTFDTALVEVYGAGNVLLDSQIVLANLGSPTLVSFLRGSRDMVSIQIASQSTGHPLNLTLDDVVFAIPEPSAFLVMAAGLVPVAAAIRRRARA